MVQYGRPSRSSFKEFVRSSFGRTVMEKAIWENPIETWLGENSKLGMSLCTLWKRIILICVCGWHKIGWKKQNLDPMWKLLNKEVDLGELTSFLDHVYLGCTQRQCKISKDIVDNYRTMFESRISAGVREVIFPSRSSYFFMVLWHGWSCKEVCGTILWVGKQDDTTTLQSMYSMHWWPPLQRWKTEICWRIVTGMLSDCSKKCWHLARIGRPDILWSVNKLARSITKWTKACDKRVNRLISYIHHNCEYKQYCHVGNTAKQWRFGLFQDSDFAGDLEDSKSTSGGTLCIFGSHTFVPISWMCKKQTSPRIEIIRFHNSRAGKPSNLNSVFKEMISDSVELWETNISHVSDRTDQPVKGKNKSHNKIDAMQDIDSVVSNVQSERQEVLLYVFEDNEAVIKMIIRGRSPTMRHVSRTNRVALDWLFDRINLDSKIQIKYIYTNNELADILIKGNFTRDEWNQLLSLFNISHSSSTVCSSAMAKRIQRESGEERVTAKSRLMMNLTARMPTGRVVFYFIKPGEDMVRISRFWEICCGKWSIRETWWLLLYRLFKMGLWSFLVFSRVEKWSYGTRSIRETWWQFLGKLQRVRPHHEDALLDGDAQSVRYGEIIHDRSEQPDGIDYQEEADS